MLEVVAWVLAIIAILCLAILWIIVQLAIVLLPILALAGMGYGLFFLGTMAVGSPRSKNSGGKDTDAETDKENIK